MLVASRSMFAPAAPLACAEGRRFAAHDTFPFGSGARFAATFTFESHGATAIDACSHRRVASAHRTPSTWEQVRRCSAVDTWTLLTSLRKPRVSAVPTEHVPLGVQRESVGRVDRARKPRVEPTCSTCILRMCDGFKVFYIQASTVSTEVIQGCRPFAVRHKPSGAVNKNLHSTVLEPSISRFFEVSRPDDASRVWVHFAEVLKMVYKGQSVWPTHGETLLEVGDACR
jgi:hypothetical protein